MTPDSGLLFWATLYTINRPFVTQANICDDCALIRP